MTIAGLIHNLACVIYLRVLLVTDFESTLCIIGENEYHVTIIVYTCLMGTVEIDKVDNNADIAILWQTYLGDEAWFNVIHTQYKQTTVAFVIHTRDLIHKHTSSYPCFITAIKHEYRWVFS